MKRIYAEIENRANKIKEHALFRDVHTIADEDVPHKLAIWAPLFVHLTMTFRDVNRLYYAYKNPQNEYEHEINAHAEIDSTHWQYLVEDLKLIGCNENPGSYQDILLQIWSDEGLPIRHYMYALSKRAQACGDSVFLRASVMEAGETTVKLFFSTTRLIAKKFHLATGKKLQYFGEDHIRSEIDNCVDTSIFSTVVLDEDTAEKALQLVGEHFNKFKEFLDYKYVVTFHQASS